MNQRSMEAGWKYGALVVPHEAVAAGAMIPAMEALHQLGLRMMVFSDPDEAFGWLARFDN